MVVRDVSAAQAELSALLGLTWGPVLAIDTYEVRDGAGEDRTTPTTFCYSVEEPRLELVQEVAGSVWTVSEGSNLHHIGFWSTDLPGDSARLAAAGWALELCGRQGAHAPVSFAYHRNELGARIELVDAALRPTMEGFLFRPESS
jgi:hypothetical protein